MAINHEDGTYGLDLWLGEQDEENPDDTEYSESADELRARAATLMKAGRFRQAALYRWGGDWIPMESWSATEAI
jgi:hypothetical protein